MLDEVARENERHHASDSDETDTDASDGEDPGEIVLPRWVIRSERFTYRNRKRARRRLSRVRADQGLMPLSVPRWPHLI
ncbi:hypothetical protein PG984_008354 [Apiospora sp. TS-2023a]